LLKKKKKDLFVKEEKKRIDLPIVEDNDANDIAAKLAEAQNHQLRPTTIDKKGKKQKYYNNHKKNDLNHNEQHT